MSHMLKSAVNAWSEYNVNEQLNRIKINELEKKRLKAKKALLKTVMKYDKSFVLAEKVLKKRM